MTKAPQKQRHKTPNARQRQTARTEIPMVASLGVQARLAPSGPEREHEMACLITRYQRVGHEWDRLVQQAIALLGSEVHPNRPRERSSARAPAE